MPAPIPINTTTCAKGAFWSQEILSGKQKPQPGCCTLFSNDPKELPEFCPPTAAWCKYEEKAGTWPQKAKNICCKDFGSELTSCKKGTPAPVADQNEGISHNDAD